jgi:hypothetical protein
VQNLRAPLERNRRSLGELVGFAILNALEQLPNIVLAGDHQFIQIPLWEQRLDFREFGWKTSQNLNPCLLEQVWDFVACAYHRYS